MIKLIHSSKIAILISFIVVTTSCNRIAETGKKVINKTGETVGKGVSEFAQGVEEGVSKSYEFKLEISEEVSKLGLRTSKFKINKNSTDSNKTLSVYCMFMADFKQNLVVKVMDKNRNEYGRVNQTIEKLKGEAQFFDFTFEENVDFEEKSIFVIDLAK